MEHEPTKGLCLSFLHFRLLALHVTAFGRTDRRTSVFFFFFFSFFSFQERQTLNTSYLLLNEAVDLMIVTVNGHIYITHHPQQDHQLDC